MRRIIVLASASKRRSQILNSCGIEHVVAASGVAEERGAGRSAVFLVKQNAESKAEKVALRYKDAIIIGADTLVCSGGQLIGKPKNERVAKRLLALFSGRRVEVFTGLYIIDTASGKRASGYARSTIFAEKIDRKDVKRYFRNLGPYDKAGGFSIEGVGSLIFDNIAGSYFNILGLPMAELGRVFKKIGLDILDFCG